MKDLTKIPHVKLTPEEQKEFERRAHIVDDNNNPPVIIKRIGKNTKGNIERLKNQMTEEEKQKGAEERWDSVASEPLEDHPIPDEILEKWKREGKI